jgi:four helix bundle protein
MKNCNSEVRRYDLALRTRRLGISVINVLRTIPQDLILRPIISQLVRSSTSIGANYAEADAANTRKDFMYKLSICRKESKETMYWISLLREAYPRAATQLTSLENESLELIRIFSAVLAKQ